MEGTVLHYDDVKKCGIVRDKNGERYEFHDEEWKSNSIPRAGAAIDFVIEDSAATKIYTVQTPGFANNISTKIADFQDSNLGKKINVTVSNTMHTKLGDLFSGGMHNKFGALSAMFLLVSLFFPIVEIPFAGEASFIDDGAGKLLFVLTATLILFFYGGAAKLYMQVIAAIILGMLFLNYYDIFSGLSQANDMVGMFGGRGRNAPNFFEFIEWGTFVNIVACCLLFVAAFLKGYVQNEKVI